MLFQTHELECSTFPKSEALSDGLALFHYMCLCDVLCGSLGVIKFDIWLVASHFFKNIHLLLIFKCIVHYLVLSLILLLVILL